MREEVSERGWDRDKEEKAVVKEHSAINLHNDYSAPSRLDQVSDDIDSAPNFSDIFAQAAQ